jgi:DNA-binding NarL/FixJ family response regulator
MKRPNPIRILLVDDHSILRQGLASMINTQRDMQVVADAPDGIRAIELFRTHRPDLTLMDLRMPGLTGAHAIQRIRKEFPEARILVLTTYDGDEDIYRALQAGAHGYLLKDIPREEFFTALRSVHRGEYCIPPQIAARLAQRTSSSDLSGRELEVLNLIVAGKTNKEIGAILDVSENTVKSHVNAILAKLNANDRTHAATSALRRGIVHLQ